jgi:DNA repair protein SbcC/Rad50
VAKRDIVLQPGLNVILGPNEAGKSTLVNAIFAALFLHSANKKADRDHLTRFMPVAGGDTISVTVEFTCPLGEDYTLIWSWGATRACRLESAGGPVITGAESVAEKMAGFLAHGRGTYEGVLFARQDEMIRTVGLLRQNQEATRTLGDTLRAALLAAGGVSVDELAAEVAAAKKELLDNWDLERDAPQNNRGVDNPYKKNVGRLLAAYYDMEMLKRALRAARLAEDRVAEIELKLSEAKALQEILQPEKEALEAVAEDVQKRASLAPRLEKLAMEEKSLKEINVKWPQMLTQLEHLTSRMPTAQKQLAEITLELQVAKEAAAAKHLLECYRAARPLVGQLKALSETLAALPVVEAADIKWLEARLAEMAAREAELSAMKLTGKITVARPLELELETGLQHRETKTVQAEEILSGEGRLVLRTEGWTVDIRAGQGDVDQILAAVRTASSEMDEKLEAMGVAHMAGARDIQSQRQQLELQMHQLQAQINGVLQGRDYAALEQGVGALPRETAAREAETVLTEKIRLESEVQHIEKELKAASEQLTLWEAEFGNHDAVMDRLAAVKGEARLTVEKLGQLAPLPEAYADAEAFLTALARLQKEAKQVETQIFTLRLELMDAQNSLPALSSEELEWQQREAAEVFARLRKEADALLAVETAFVKVAADIDSQTFVPFTEAFARYLSPATGFHYQAAALEGALPTAIRSTDGRELPVDLLSTGTTRGIALALRLAMAEFLLAGGRGFMVMDDPLVDLDPGRREHAAKMVQDYAKERQLIITTCDPETARLLGGHDIMFT